MNLEHKELTPVPNIIFRTQKDGDWLDLSSDELFKGKKVITFSNPKLAFVGKRHRNLVARQGLFCHKLSFL